MLEMTDGVGGCYRINLHRQFLTLTSDADSRTSSLYNKGCGQV